MINKAKRRAPSPPFPFPPPSETQQPAALSIKRRALSPPPPFFPPTLQTAEGSGGNLAHDSPPPPLPPLNPLPPLSNLPLLDEDGDGVLTPEEICRVKLRKIEKQSCELDMSSAWTTLIQQIQQGVKLKPVSSHILTE